MKLIIDRPRYIPKKNNTRYYLVEKMENGLPRIPMFEKPQQVCIRLPKNMHKKLKDMADERNLTFNAYMNAIIRSFLLLHENEEKKKKDK